MRLNLEKNLSAIGFLAGIERTKVATVPMHFSNRSVADKSVLL